MDFITTLDIDECSLCGGTIRLVQEPVSVRVGERAVIVDFSHRKCDSCGETFHRPEELRALRQKAAATLRQEEGLLTPDEQRDLRMALGISQTAMDDLIHAGRKTTARWEAGTVCQSGAADTLLRILKDVPEAVAYLARFRRIPVSPAVRTPPPLDPKIIQIEPHLQKRAQEAGLRRFESGYDGNPPAEAVR